MEVYKGNAPYVFVSYSHEDKETILPILEVLYKHRLRFWYDEGIYSGDEWTAIIEQQVVNCACFLTFLSQSAVESQNCRNEINLALHSSKKPKLVHLGDVTYAHGLGLQLVGLDHDVYDGDPSGLVESLERDETVARCREVTSGSHTFWWPQEHRGFASLYASKYDANDESMLSAWGPQRDGYEYGTYPERFELNACIDHPEFGDERSFAAIRKKGSERWLRGAILTPGEVYEARFRCRVHGDPEQNETGKAIALGIKSSVFVPEIVMPQQRGAIRCALHAPNDALDEVWSCVYVYATDVPLFLEFVPASAVMHNAGEADGSVMGTQLFTDAGTYLGFNKLEGFLPSGDEYACSVTFEFRALSHRGTCTVERSVSVNGGEWKTGHALVKPGDRVGFKTEFRNVADADLANVTFVDQLPPELPLVPGSTTLVNNSHPDGQALSDGIALNGFNTGLYGPGTSATITYETTVSETAKPLNLLTQSGVYHDGGSKSSRVLLHVTGAWDEPCDAASDVGVSPKEAGYLEQVPKGGWGPERDTFTMKRPAPYATFNSITDNPRVGDERLFVRMRRDGSGLPHDCRLKVEAGLLYSLWVGYDNSAAPNVGEKGVARNVRLHVSFPDHLEPYDWQFITATITSSTTDPPKVWARCAIWSTEPLKLCYVPQSAELLNGRYKGRGLRLDDRLFSPEGIPIGTNSLDGVLPSSDAEAFGRIFLLLAAM